MSWSDLPRRSFLMLAPLAGALSACGFQPVYSPGSGPGPVAVSAPDSILGYRLRERIEARLGIAAAGDPARRLDLTAEVTEQGGGVTSDGTQTRVSLRGTAGWTLIDPSGTVISSGETRNFTGYSTTGSTVATQAAAEDALARLAVILADQIILQLMALPA